MFHKQENKKPKSKVIKILIITVAIVIGVVIGIFISNKGYDIAINSYEKKYNKTHSDKDLIKLMDILIEDKDSRYIDYLDNFLLLPISEDNYKKTMLKLDSTLDVNNDEMYNENTCNAILISYAFYICKVENNSDLLYSTLIKYYPQVDFKFHTAVFRGAFINAYKKNSSFVYNNKDVFDKAFKDMVRHANANENEKSVQYVMAWCAIYDADESSDKEQQARLHFMMDECMSYWYDESACENLKTSVYQQEVDMWKELFAQ